LASGNRSFQIYSALELDRDRIWKNRPNRDQLFFGARTVTDDQGFRRSEDLKKCDASAVKIGVFGASPSFGWGVPFSNSYPALIERQLQKTNKRNICVKNFSMIGYSSTQGLVTLEKVLSRESLDLVLISYFVNDIDVIRFFKPSELTDKELLEKGIFHVFFQWEKFFKNSASFRAARVLSEKLRRQKVNNGAQRVSRVSNRVSSSELAQNYSKIIDLIRSRGALPLVISLPLGLEEKYSEYQDRKKASKSENGEDWSFSSGHSFDVIEKTMQVHKLFRSQIAKVALDKEAPYEEVPRPTLEQLDSYFLTKDNDYVHFSAKGHKKIASRLVKKVRPLIILLEKSKDENDKRSN
jgi:lysophospholipase L1-like esterase